MNLYRWNGRLARRALAKPSAIAAAYSLVSSYPSSSLLLSQQYQSQFVSSSAQNAFRTFVSSTPSLASHPVHNVAPSSSSPPTSPVPMTPGRRAFDVAFLALSAAGLVLLIDYIMKRVPEETLDREIILGVYGLPENLTEEQTKQLEKHMETLGQQRYALAVMSTGLLLRADKPDDVRHAFAEDFLRKVNDYDAYCKQFYNFFDSLSSDGARDKNRLYYFQMKMGPDDDSINIKDDLLYDNLPFMERVKHRHLLVELARAQRLLRSTSDREPLLTAFGPETSRKVREIEMSNLRQAAINLYRISLAATKEIHSSK